MRALSRQNGNSNFDTKNHVCRHHRQGFDELLMSMIYAKVSLIYSKMLGLAKERQTSQLN